MDHHVLVTYATKRGATAEIADHIGDELKKAGLSAHVWPVDEVRELEPYTAVILGSAFYIGQWRKEAVRFLEENAGQLAQRPFWLFSSGPTGEGEAGELLKGWRYPEKLEPLIDRVRPQGIALFRGNLDPDQLNFLEKWVIRNVKASVGDFRDWAAISDWAASIARALQGESPREDGA